MHRPMPLPAHACVWMCARVQASGRLGSPTSTSAAQALVSRSLEAAAGHGGRDEERRQALQRYVCGVRVVCVCMEGGLAARGQAYTALRHVVLCP